MDGIMVSAATGVMNSLLSKLTTLLGEEYKLQTRVKRDIISLKDELSSMNALLENLADMDVLDPQTKEWRNQVREMAYDIEDCIDLYIHRLHNEPDKSTGMKGLFHKTIKKVKKLGARHHIGEQIQELKTRIVEASQRRERYKLDAVLNSGSTNLETIDPRLPALYTEASSLVGIDGPTDDLIKLVDNGEQTLKVVSIMGCGGLGKTTLANQVYRKLGEQFGYQAFVSVSQKPDMKKILRNILCQIDKQEYADTEAGDEECLIKALRGFLKEKRYFIVIDDIWSAQAWKSIKCALPENTCGSRLLVTTRIASVAKSCCFPHYDTVYELRPLSEAESMSLFFRRIFGSEDRCPINLKDVSVQIIKKCGGMPLAIITMASLLTTKSERREEWVSIRNSIGLGLENNSDVEEMKRILSLSYNDLSHHLKTCLLYLSMYPEDYEIDVQQLVRMWIAEGFIKVKSGRNLMEEGECYFNELINRSMIQPVDIRFDGRAEACRVHDIILDLIVSKALEENFITVVGDPNTFGLQDKVRRLSLDYCGQENAIAMPLMLTAHVRSLVIFGYSVQMLPFDDLHALRVLDTESDKMIENCDIGKLFQLRYLRIAGPIPTHRLLRQIGELQFLETLDLSCTGIIVLPASVVKLRRMKCLLVKHAKLPDGVGNMQALEEMSGLVVDKESSINSLQELGSLTNLRILSLFWDIDESYSEKMTYANILASSLGKLVSSNLRNLRLSRHFNRHADVPLDSWSSPPRLLRELHISSYCLQGLPQWMTSLASLTNLCIRVNQVTQETLQILGDLPALLRLELWSQEDSNPIEKRSVCSNQFRCLKVLKLYSYFVVLMFHAGAMPKLEDLSFEFEARQAQSAVVYPNLGIHHLSSLKQLTVWIDCEGARVEEVQAFEDAMGNAASLLPNRPKPQFLKFGSTKMAKEGGEEGRHVTENTKQPEEIPTQSSEALPSSASN